jgi:hypothetical protein
MGVPTLNTRQIGKVVRQTVAVEQRPRNLEVGRRKYGPSSHPGGLVAKSPGGGIGAMSGTTPGSATCTLYNFDGTSLTAGDTDTVFNMASTAVAANKFLQVKSIQGHWFVDVEDC